MSPDSGSLHHLVPTYRRDSGEVIGAVRRSSVEFIGMEQMPGGKFQITCRTVSGADAFVSPVKTSLAEGLTALEFARRTFGGEPVDDLGPVNAVAASVSHHQPTPTSSDLAFIVGLDRQEEPPARPEPRRPAFVFGDVEAPELPTSVR